MQKKVKFLAIFRDLKRQHAHHDFGHDSSILHLSLAATATKCFPTRQQKRWSSLYRCYKLLDRTIAEQETTVRVTSQLAYCFTMRVCRDKFQKCQTTSRLKWKLRPPSKQSKFSYCSPCYFDIGLRHKLHTKRYVNVDCFYFRQQCPYHKLRKLKNIDNAHWANGCLGLRRRACNKEEATPLLRRGRMHPVKKICEWLGYRQCNLCNSAKNATGKYSSHVVR